MDDLGIEYQTVLGFPPVDFVHLAADLGCRYISMKARGGGGPYNPYDHPPFSFLDDLSLRRRMIAAMSQRGVSISLGEGFVVQPGTDLLDDRASLDLMSEFGVTRANAVTMDPDLNRSFDQFAAFAEAAAQRGMETTMEFAKSLTLSDLDTALSAVRHVGRPDFRLLIDTMHVARSGSTARRPARRRRGPDAVAGAAGACGPGVRSPGRDRCAGGPGDGQRGPRGIVSPSEAKEYRVRISLTIPNNHKVRTLLQPWQEDLGGDEIGEVAALADRLGFSRLTVGEHFLMAKDRVEISGAHYVHAPTTLAYLAGRTSRIRLASNISIVALQHPVVQAKQWAVLDWLSGGRADLMAGAGWLKEEFEVLGVDFRTRGRRLDEYVEAMRRIWTSELASYEGEFVAFHEIASEPKPLQPGGVVPIWFAGDVRETLARVAKWGVGWSPYLLPPQRIAAGIEQIRLHPGYRGQPIGVFYNLANLRLSEDHHGKADDHDFDTWNVQRLVDQLCWIRDLGVTEVTPPLPRLAGYRHFLERLHWLAEEIMPRVG